MNTTLQSVHKTARPAAKAGFLSTLGTWLRRSRTRRELAALPPYLLKDIGINEADRYQEVSKPFWQQ
ncbi:MULTISPECIES: DUF1127 domain-containing protein [Oceanimonas]|uniref:DUF1127 domain-containing protein n=1 Tax=Oceanimonas smirnovii TaxID=264574 RepID=A0ABW7NXM6_9GAMM|nr:MULTISPECIES: DUF1127 domain-containing protein [Oceanimonas]MDV2858613.1 DUF1127 domain-containing protein [Oceanimonas sp. CAM02]